MSKASMANHAGLAATVGRSRNAVLIAQPYQPESLSQLMGPKRNISFNSMERAVGQYAADTFIESMNLNSKSIVSVFTETITTVILNYPLNEKCIAIGYTTSIGRGPIKPMQLGMVHWSGQVSTTH